MDRDLRPRARDVARVLRAVRLVWQSAPGWTGVATALVLVQGVLPLASLYLTKLVVDAVSAGLTATDRAAAAQHVVVLIALAAGVGLLSAALRSLERLTTEAQSQLLTDRMQSVLHAKSVAVDLAYYENSDYYDTLHRAQREAPYRPGHIVSGLVQAVQSGVSALCIAGLLSSFHWSLALVIFAAAAPTALVQLRYARVLYGWQRDRTSLDRRASYLDWLLVSAPHAKEVRVFALGEHLMQRYRELRARLRGERLSLATRRAGADTAAQACSVLAVFGAFAFVAVRALQGHNTIGDVVMCLQAFQRIQGALVELLRSLAGLYEDNLFLGNLYEFLDLEPTVTDPPEPVPAPERLTSGIALEHVSFRYPGAGRSVLSDVTVTIRPGQVVALVGENGSGKTTLVKLLCRLHDPTSGVVRLDGTDLRDFAVADVRALFSIIFQDYAHYHFTVRENIRFGDLRAPDDDGRVEAAAALAGADQVVERLPQGYETTLGKWFPEGEELSIGEWQKIALARAFMRDSAVVVLDEPTSALDAKAEAEVFARFRALVKERTAILVSHRFSTVRLADCIYVLADGRVTETGSHDELMALGGTYARLFELQAQSYR